MALLNNESKRNAGAEQPFKSLSLASSWNAGPTSAVEELLPSPSHAVLTPTGSNDCFGPSSKVSGKLTLAGPALIEGRVDGEIDATDSLVIGRKAVLTAKIKGMSIIVAGTVSGEISASERIELYASAKVLGNLTAPKLVVHEGAVFEGDCAMPPQGARADRKLAVLRQQERPVPHDDGQEPA